MFFCYGMVALSSIMENIVGVPFTHQWTLRVSRAPKVRISDDAPLVRFLECSSIVRNIEIPFFNQSDAAYRPSFPPPPRPDSDPPDYPMPKAFDDIPFPRLPARRSTEVLDALETGFDCKG